MIKERHTVDVLGISGGQGATTIAGALARIWDCELVSRSTWEDEWIFGPPCPGGGSGRVRDLGARSSQSSEQNARIVVVRGPSAVATRRARAMEATADVVIIREPWRAISRQEFERSTNRSVVAEVGFSSRVARMADAGLLGQRLGALDEFDQLRRWARSITGGSATG